MGVGTGCSRHGNKGPLSTHSRILDVSTVLLTGPRKTRIIRRTPDYEAKCMRESENSCQDRAVGNLIVLKGEKEVKNTPEEVKTRTEGPLGSEFMGVFLLPQTSVFPICSTVRENVSYFSLLTFKSDSSKVTTSA